MPACLQCSWRAAVHLHACRHSLAALTCTPTQPPTCRRRAGSPLQAAVNGFVAAALGPRALRLEYMGLDSEQPLFAIDILA